MNAAAKRSLALEKWRYNVARATLALRVTASMVTALGPPERRSAVAASSSRARERAGRGSCDCAHAQAGTVIVYTTSSTGNKTIGLCTETVSLESIHLRRATSMVDTLARSDQDIDASVANLSKRSALLAADRRRTGRVAGHLLDGRAERRAARHRAGDRRDADATHLDRRRIHLGAGMPAAAGGRDRRPIRAARRTARRTGHLRVRVDRAGVSRQSRRRSSSRAPSQARARRSSCPRRCRC